MSPPGDPSRANRVVKEGNTGNVHSFTSNISKTLRKIVMGSGSQGDHQTQKTKYQQEGYKQKRNSEQRRPAKLTLDKFFTPLQKISKTFTQQGKRDHINESTQRRRKPDKTDVPPSPAVVTPTTTKKPKVDIGLSS